MFTGYPQAFVQKIAGMTIGDLSLVSMLTGSNHPYRAGHVPYPAKDTAVALLFGWLRANPNALTSAQIHIVMAEIAQDLANWVEVPADSRPPKWLFVAINGRYFTYSGCPAFKDLNDGSTVDPEGIGPRTWVLTVDLHAIGQLADEERRRHYGDNYFTQIATSP
jgi:hypothetical protein